MITLKAGDKAPAIKTTDHEGKPFSLAAQKGNKVVLYFYPKDNTPGCTKEACSFRDHHERFLAEGYTIVGVSPDSAARHQKFIDKFDLPFILLPDEDKSIIQAYGAWGPKKFMGKEFDGVLRSTFVIDEKGVIERVIEKVKTAQAAEQILDTEPA